MNATNPQRLDGGIDRTVADDNPRVYPTSEPTLGELITSLSDDFTKLIRNEIRLARVETMEAVSTASRGAGMLAAGGMVAYAGLILVLIALSILLGQALENYWLSTLIVGAVVLIIGAVLLFSGKSALQKVNVTPEKTIETLKEDARWVKEQVS